MSDVVFEGFLDEQLSKGLALAAQSDLVKVTPCGDRLGAPDRYLVRLSCKGLVRNAGLVVEHEDFVVGVCFSPDYLRRVDAGQLLTWLRPASVWHPNIAPPFVCPGFITPAMELTPVLLRREALEECAALTRRAGPQETGGLLIGLFHVDPASRRVFVEVTSQIPARGTVQQRDSPAFTPQTWEAAEAAIKLRRGREVILGWWHSHPVFAWDVPADRQALPSPDFFSQRDTALHRTVFCRGYNVALVLTNCGDAGRLSSRLYGWRHGMIARRGLYLLSDSNTEDCD